MMARQDIAVSEEAARELVLTHSPLVRVLTQVKWPRFADFDLTATAAGLGKLISAAFPLVEQAPEMEITFTPDGAQQQASGVLHKFTSIDNSWAVTLGGTFLAIETSAYTSHEDFIERLRVVTTALASVAEIRVWDRLGYRYTNRLTEEDDLANLNEYFDTAVLGSAALDIPHGLVHSITESVFEADGSRLLVRSAFLPPRGTIDPTIPVSEGKSWYLDLDAFREIRTPFSPESLTETATQLARTAYTYFREVITDEFKRRFA